MTDAYAALLVVAKAPVVGEAKTRLGERVGMGRAGELAAAALLDTLDAVASVVAPRHRYVALAGSLEEAVGGDRIRAALRDWSVFSQHGETFAARLRHAHEETARRHGGAVVQIGMDTPHLDPLDLRRAERALDDADAVLGPADDGGWWLLGVRSPDLVAGIEGVPMSTPDTARRTVAALHAAGAGSVRTIAAMRDVDEASDAAAVAALAPGTRFAAQWGSLPAVAQ